MGRSISDVLKTYESFTERGIHLVCLSDGIDTRRNNDIMTKAMVTLLGGGVRKWNVISYVNGRWPVSSERGEMG
ncbi:recombinase family protein [Bacillus toyonensis]|uniref:recombinase family protein n=1 Tax=Bacillus toyonensis TaxID=155322 RepID=UPI0020D282FE|nr:recombinase family protein [Bacillus toyonensis]